MKLNNPEIAGSYPFSASLYFNDILYAQSDSAQATLSDRTVVIGNGGGTGTPKPTPTDPTNDDNT